MQLLYALVASWYDRRRLMGCSFKSLQSITFRSRSWLLSLFHLISVSVLNEPNKLHVNSLFLLWLFFMHTSGIYTHSEITRLMILVYVFNWALKTARATVMSLPDTFWDPSAHCTINSVLVLMCFWSSTVSVIKNVLFTKQYLKNTWKQFILEHILGCIMCLFFFQFKINFMHLWCRNHQTFLRTS